MNTQRNHRPLSRRRFIQRSGLASAGGVVTALAGRWAQAADSRDAGKAANPFAYDVNRLRQVDPKLIHYEQIGRIPTAHDEPRRLAIGADGLLYVAAGNYVSVMDRDGARGTEIALTAPPRCLAIETDGLIYVGLRDHIEVFDHKGQRRGAWDVPGPRTWFTGLALGERDVFAADAGNRIVLRYDKSGKLAGRIGERNKERNIPGFIVPSPFFDLELHPDGLLRVVNPGRHRVEAYTVDGDFEFAWGKAAMAIDGFCGCCNPINLALTPNGRFVTCEKGLPRVKVYRTDGTLESVVAGPDSFPENAKACAADAADCIQGGLDAAVDAQGRIYILDLATKEVRIMARKATPSA